MSVEFMAIDVRVLTHPKMVRAIARGGGDVVWLWLGLLAWTHEHDGAELPRDCVSVVSGPGPDRKRKNLLSVLTECGLIDESETGFRPHDFDLWEAGAGSYIVRRTERERKKAQRKAAREKGCPGHVRDMSGTVVGQEPDMSGNGVRDTSGTCPPRAPARARETRPDQTRSDQTASTRVQSGDPLAPEPQSELPSGVPGKVPCPRDLRLTEGQRATLAVSGVPGWAVDAITAGFVSRALGDEDERRTLVVWRKCLAAAVSGTWNDPQKRPKQQTDLGRTDGLDDVAAGIL